MSGMLVNYYPNHPTSGVAEQDMEVSLPLFNQAIHNMQLELESFDNQIKKTAQYQPNPYRDFGKE